MVLICGSSRLMRFVLELSRVLKDLARFVHGVL
jgi:hypothetical protein